MDHLGVEKSGWDDQLSSLTAHSPTQFCLECTISYWHSSSVVEQRHTILPHIWVWGFDNWNPSGGIFISLHIPPSALSPILTLLLPTHNGIAVLFLLCSLPSPPSHAPNTQVKIKSQVWQCWNAYIEAGNKLKWASRSNTNRALCPRPDKPPTPVLPAPNNVLWLHSWVT